MNSIAPLARSKPHASIAHYVAFLFQTEVGDWRVLFPDVAGCEAQGFTVQDATYSAATALARCAGVKVLRPPRSLAQIESDQLWFAAHRITLKETLVTMVPLRGISDSLQL